MPVFWCIHRCPAHERWAFMSRLRLHPAFCWDTSLAARVPLASDSMTWAVYWCSCSATGDIFQEAARSWRPAQLWTAESGVCLPGRHEQQAFLLHQSPNDGRRAGRHHPLRLPRPRPSLQCHQPGHGPESVRQGLRVAGADLLCSTPQEEVLGVARP